MLVLQRLLLHPHGSPCSALPHPLALLLLTTSAGKGACQQVKVHVNSQAKVHVNRKKYISTVRQRYMSTGNGTSQQSGKGTCQQVKVQANISNKSATGKFPTLLSLAGAAISIIFVATNVLSQ